MTHARRSRIVAGLALAATLTVPAVVATVSASGSGAVGDVPTAGPFGTTVTFDGHGFGHGIGLSQYGALGYALAGSAYGDILAHYYGGTNAGTAPNDLISVRLTALDGLAQTAVVSQPGTVQTSAGGGAWTSVVARSLGANLYEVWGHATSAICPGATVPSIDAGWQLITASASGPIEISSTADTTASTDLAALLGVCESGGRVRSHRGYVFAANDSAGSLRTLNVQPIESYLRSVVGAEVPWSWGNQGGGLGMEALKAQAVAARSYALAQSRYTYNAPDGNALRTSPSTCDTQACQVYRGAALRTSVAAAFTGDAIYEFPNTDLGIAATAGQVRRWPDGRMVSTMFSSSSGGWTSPGAGFTPVVDLGDAVASNTRHNWTIQVPVATVEARWPSIGTLQSIVVNRRNGFGDMGGRISPELGKVVVVTGDRGSVSLTGDEVRTALGLHSNWFTVRTACAGRDEPTVTGAAVSTVQAGFAPISPVRVIDTRDGTGTIPGQVRVGCTLAVDLPNPPAGAVAAAINITTTLSWHQGFITAYPCGTPRPFTAVLQTQIGQNVPGTTVVPLGPDGRVCLYSSVQTDVVVDLMGWFASSGSSNYRPESPKRVLDTRATGPRPPAFALTRVQVTGLDGRPSGASAASVNIAATEATAAGWVTAFPCDNPDLTAILNVRPGLDISNHAFVKLDVGGGFCLRSNIPVHLVVDVDGVFGPFATQRFTLTTPQRAVDTRENIGTTEGRFRQFETRAVDLGAPSGSVVFGLTVVNPERAGHVTVFPCGGDAPTTAVVNAPARTNVAALVVVPTDAEGRVCFATVMATDLVVDVAGRSN